MITREELRQRQEQAKQYFQRAGIFITDEEKARIEVADFNLNRFEEIGLGVLVYVNTQRCCAKELAIWPHQTCPEHLHPSINGLPGKEETFRCRWGKVYVYVPGEATIGPACKAPRGCEESYTVWHQIELNPGEQYTLAPDTLHWFQAGPLGAVVSEFSTHSTDENDIFTDQEIDRFTKIRE